MVGAGAGCLMMIGTFLHHWFVSGPRIQPGTNWIGKAVGGPLEIRPLPSGLNLRRDFTEWVAASPGARVRLYEVVLPGGAVQFNCDHRVVWGETPLGQAPTTFVQFDYVDPATGLYRFHWSHPGVQSDNWVRAAEHPLRLLVQPIHLKLWPQPEVQVVAIEGVQASGCLVAVDHQHLLTTANDDEDFHLSTPQEVQSVEHPTKAINL